MKTVVAEKKAIVSRKELLEALRRIEPFIGHENSKHESRNIVMLFDSHGLEILNENKGKANPVSEKIKTVEKCNTFYAVVDYFYFIQTLNIIKGESSDNLIVKKGTNFEGSKCLHLISTTTINGIPIIDSASVEVWR